MLDCENMTLDEIVNGFSFNANDEAYSCLFCDMRFERGMVFPVRGGFADAKKAAQLHIECEHGSVFNMLLAEDKRTNGLTETQKALLRSFYEGKSDKKIAIETATAQSTVRYQRFSFREKARQAKIILALSVLLEQQRGHNDQPKIHEGATMVDERYLPRFRDDSPVSD